MRSIQALIAPPGAGKTTWLINHINDNQDQRSIIAFPTKYLSAEVQSRLTNLKLSFNAIDSDTVDGSVIQCLEEALLSHNDQIIICTHASLRLIKADTLQDWHLYIDEIPTTWDCDTLSFNDLSYRTALEQFAEPDDENSNRLKAKANCKQLMGNLANQTDSALSNESRRLLKALLDERYIVEADQLDTNQVRTVRIVGTKQYIPVFEAAKTTVVMAAEIEKSLLGVILRGAGWTVTPIEANLGFKGYGNNVIIHPFLAANETYSKSKALLKSGKLEASYKEGCLLDEWLQHDVFRVIGSKKAILVAHSWCNPKLPITEDGQSNITRTNIDSRGLNEYDDYRIAICLQHGNLTPFENDRSTPTLAKLLSIKHEIYASDIKDAIKYERFYESTLQSVCRTALRSQADQGEITLFVQDQDIAAFLSSKIGNCKIDESYSIAAVRADSAATVNRHRLMQKAITLNDQGHDPHFIAAQINRNVRTVRNWLKSYHQLKIIQGD